MPPEPGTASSHPRLCSSTSTACQIAPVCTVTTWLSKSIFSTAFIRSRPIRMQPSRMPWPMKVEERPQMKMGTVRSFATRTIALTCSVVRGRTMTAGMPPGVGPQSRVWQMRSTSLSLTYSAPQMAASRSVRLLNVPPFVLTDVDDGRSASRRMTPSAPGASPVALRYILRSAILTQHRSHEPGAPRQNCLDGQAALALRLNRVQDERALAGRHRDALRGAELPAPAPDRLASRATARRRGCAETCRPTR